MVGRLLLEFGAPSLGELSGKTFTITSVMLQKVQSITL
jgi:hypothetical protein